jgi:hypothetical protein
MTPLEQFAYALLESAAPVTEIVDDVCYVPPHPEELRALLGTVLAPLETLFEPRDLLTATAVLEAAAPVLVETMMLVPRQGPLL